MKQLTIGIKMKLWKWLKQLFKKKKRYKYEESEAIGSTYPPHPIGQDQFIFENHGNVLNSISNITIENKTFDGGELQIFFENCHNITIKNCVFKNVSSSNGHCLLFYSCSQVKIIDSDFLDCRVGNSEAVAINTNCQDFIVEGCTFSDIDNLPLDVISGERDDKYTGNVIIRKNEFYNCGYRQDYWTACGPYVDGASDILIKDNVIDCTHTAALGIEIGAENKRTAENITVKNNLIKNARKYGLLVGSYKKNMGGVKGFARGGNAFIGCANNYKEQYNVR